MVIRKAEHRDINDILRLLHQVAKVHHDLRPDLFVADKTKYNAEELAVLIEDENYYIVVAEENEKVFGYIIGILREPQLEVLQPIKTMYIDDLCVDEESRGQAVGKSLYKHIVDVAKELECYNITLNVWGSNDAMEFYESMNLKIQKIGMEYIL